ncbi:beta-lactamase transpeptidase [Pyrrhoderma noxium]|uniref:Beta-lactamase transpeptidase n=1 Tax=Pyrrhoderma noxium TaxID=2282107 RepID=A0A286UL26_9AGAM|nr:beta-lactamase transpeptidase [Pyrrhoderma noxium]
MGQEATPSKESFLKQFEQHAKLDLQNAMLECERKTYKWLEKLEYTGSNLTTGTSGGSVWLCAKYEKSAKKNSKIKSTTEVLLLCWYLPHEIDDRNPQNPYNLAKKEWESDIRKKIEEIKKGEKKGYNITYNPNRLSIARCVHIFSGIPSGIPKSQPRYNFRMAEFKYNPFQSETNETLKKNTELPKTQIGKLTLTSRIRDGELNVNSSCYGVIWKCTKSRATNTSFNKKEETDVAVLGIYRPDEKKYNDPHKKQIVEQWNKDAEKWIESIKKDNTMNLNDTGLHTLRYEVYALDKYLAEFHVKLKVDSEKKRPFYLILFRTKKYEDIEKTGIRKLGNVQIPALRANVHIKTTKGRLQTCVSQVRKTSQKIVSQARKAPGKVVSGVVYPFVHRRLGIARAYGTSELGAWRRSDENDRPSDSEYFLLHLLIKALLPNDWRLADKWAEEKASLHDILSHVSGQAGHDFSYIQDDTMKDIVHRLRYHQSPFELREKYVYYGCIHFRDLFRKIL